MSNNLADNLKNVSEKDRKQIEQAQEMLGPDPDTMGFIKNLFWGNYRSSRICINTCRCSNIISFSFFSSY